jgi:hypothetical protein
MSRAAFSVKVFAVYVFFMGGALVFGPNLLLPLLGLAPTDEVWVRIVGVLAFNIGLYVWNAARHEDRPFMEVSVVTRVLAFGAFAAFVLAGLASPVIALFGAIDLAGAAWTWCALQADARQAAATRAGLPGTAA